MDSICSAEVCDKPAKCRGYCNVHYQRLLRLGDANAPVKERELHGLHGHPLQKTWQQMIARCYMEGSTSYKWYGALGTKVCERWRYSFRAFIHDVGDKPSPLHTLDRKDSDGHYSCGICDGCKAQGWPPNYRWSDKSLQSWNRRKRRTNTSGYIGVMNDRGRWKAELGHTVNGTKYRYYLGMFDTPEEAAIAYDIAVIFFRGHEGVTNIL